MALEPLCEGEGVGGVALTTEVESLETLNQLEGAERVEAGANVAEDLDAHADGKGDGTKGIIELEAVVAVGGFVELGETRGVLAPVELAGIDNDTGDGGAVASDPLGGRVYDDVRA